MVLNFLSGGAAINVLARHGGIQSHVVDAGVGGDWPAELLRQPNFFSRSVRRGTRNFYREPAMTDAECEQAIEIGREQVRLAVEAGIDVLGIGEMGIGNTTAASALVVALLGFDAEKAVGRGTGISNAVLNRKVEVVEGAVKKHDAQAIEPRGRYWLQAIGGYEIAAMTGTVLEAGRVRMPLVVDGFIATAAAAAAFDIDPACREVCFFSHRSDEQAHGNTLKALGVEPILDLKMRLGEGTGAALAMHLLEASAKILCEMATFDSAGYFRCDRLARMNAQSHHRRHEAAAQFLSGSCRVLDADSGGQSLRFPARGTLPLAGLLSHCGNGRGVGRWGGPHGWPFVPALIDRSSLVHGGDSCDDGRNP